MTDVTLGYSTQALTNAPRRNIEWPDLREGRRKGYREVKTVSKLSSALVIVGGGFAAAPAAALELADATVHSALGQPLRASISYALGPNEAIADTCVSLVPASGGGGLPSVHKGSVAVADGVITITGSAIVREPMVSMRLSIRCPYTAHLVRDYLLFVDPAESRGAPIEAPTAAQVGSRPQLASPAALRGPGSARTQPVTRTPIAAASRYLVQPGDSLSAIAQRIDNRPVDLWAAVNAIFAANPDAFLDDDPGKLKAGSWLTIPAFGVEATLATAEPAATAAAAVDPVIPAADGAAYDPFALEQELEAFEEAPLADLQPGDIIAPTGEIPDTRLEGPATVSSSPNVPVAVIRRPPPAPEETVPAGNGLVWLGGAGVALILGLLLFGRRLFSRFGSAPIAPAMRQDRATDVSTDTEKVEALNELDLEIDDDAPTEENLALDADLVIGTGLQEGTDVDIASDFAFASTAELDIELTEEMADNDDTAETDIIPPINIEQSSILESEVLPSDEDDEYDMSVIVDATQMPDPEDVTERDLAAVAVDDDDEALITGNYTVSQEVDYKILEQDYEDEMTATQALNAEIQRAAEDFAVFRDEAQASLATVHELDITANRALDDSTLEATVEMPKKGGKTG